MAQTNRTLRTNQMNILLLCKWREWTSKTFCLFDISPSFHRCYEVGLWFRSSLKNTLSHPWISRLRNKSSGSIWMDRSRSLWGISEEVWSFICCFYWREIYHSCHYSLFRSSWSWEGRSFEYSVCKVCSDLLLWTSIRSHFILRFQ